MQHEIAAVIKPEQRVSSWGIAEKNVAGGDQRHFQHRDQFAQSQRTGDDGQQIQVDQRAFEAAGVIQRPGDKADHRPRFDGDFPAGLFAVDVEVTELIPNVNKSKKNLIPKDIYDTEVQIQKDLQIELDNLNSNIPLLNKEIDDLQIELEKQINERLKIEQTQDVLQNQLNTLTDLIELYSTKIAQVVQKSTDESILRTSLESQNAGLKAQIEGLIKQIETLYAIITGLLNQIGAEIRITKTQIFPSTPGGAGGGREDGNNSDPSNELKKYK